MSAFVRLLIVLIAIMGSAHANTCKFVSKTCIDTLQPKNVSGTNVFFSDVGIVDACWQWQSNYECVDNTSPTVVNYCAALESISQCRVTNSVCARTSPVNGTCEMYTKTFRVATLLAAFQMWWCSITHTPSPRTRLTHRHAMTTQATLLASCPAKRVQTGRAQKCFTPMEHPGLQPRLKLPPEQA